MALIADAILEQNETEAACATKARSKRRLRRNQRKLISAQDLREQTSIMGQRRLRSLAEIEVAAIMSGNRGKGKVESVPLYSVDWNRCWK